MKSILIDYAHICAADISTYLGQVALEIQRADNSWHASSQ